LTSYEKLKYLIKKLLKHEMISKSSDELEDIKISENMYRKFVTKMNHAKIIESLFKGENYFKIDLINKNYFFDSDKNACIISSIVHLEKKTIKSSIINYIFKSVPEQFNFMFNNNFSDTFNENLSILLQRDERFIYFSSLIQLNSDEIKIVCDIETSKSNKNLKIVPLEYFIYDSLWYLCFYNLESKQLEILSSIEILSSYVLKEEFSQYIKKNDIKNKIITFVNNLQINHKFLIKLSVETLNQLIETKLIDDFSVYTEKKFFDDEDEEYDEVNIICKDMIERPTFNIKIYDLLNENKNIKPKRNRLYKINLNPKKVSLNNPLYNYENSFPFENNKITRIVERRSIFFNQEKYFVKISSTKRNFDCIMKKFNDIEIVDENLYRI
jgi:hypothetical protein